MAAQKHQNIEPVERIDQSHDDVYVVLQPVPVINIEVEELSGR